jgi:hypothetical protein
MKYARPVYMQEGIPIVKGKRMFSADEFIDIPKLDYPIPPVENFKRVAARDKPLWVPNSMAEFDSFMIGIPGSDLTLPAIDKTTRTVFTDIYQTEWVWVPEVGGPMLRPGTKYMDSVLDWEAMVHFPNLRDTDWASLDGDFMNTRYNPEKVLHFNMGQSMTERLVSLVGGYEDFLVSLLEEPEAVRAFFDRFADCEIEMFDSIMKHYPVSMVTLHDDWGTERDTFFSEKVMEALVLDPTKRIMDHIHAHGAAVELHSCGKIERFMPYMIEMGVDFLQIQSRAYDIPMLKEKYGDKIGFCSMIQGFQPGQPTDDGEKYLQAVRSAVDSFAKGGGMYTSISASQPEHIWSGVCELFYYSREYYEAEN